MTFNEFKRPNSAVQGGWENAQAENPLLAPSTDSREEFKEELLEQSGIVGGKRTVCSRSVVVTTYDFESGRPGSNPEWGPIYYEASITAQSLPEPSSLQGSTQIPEQLNIKAVAGACILIDGCSLELCSATPSVASSGICHRNKVNSIPWWLLHEIVSVTIHYNRKAGHYTKELGKQLLDAFEQFGQNCPTVYKSVKNWW